MSIRCSGCGKKIPEVGQVCPYCQRDKTADKNIQAAAFAGAFMTGIVGYLMHGFGGFFIGMIPGMIIGMIIGMIKNPNAGKTPPSVRVEPSIPSAPSYRHIKAYAFEHELQPNDNTAERLAKLKQLHSSGVITADEYDSQRQNIIGKL